MTDDKSPEMLDIPDKDIQLEPQPEQSESQLSPEEQLAQNFEIVEAEVPYEKKATKQIFKEAEQIRPEDVANEVLGWLISNVENYVENDVKMFKLDLVLDAEENAEEMMVQTRKLQDLFRAIPDDEYTEFGDTVESLQGCRQMLNDMVEAAKAEMDKSEDKLEELAKRLIYYYEVKGISAGLPIIQEQQGIVDVLKFEYEAFNVGVQVLKGEDVVDSDEGAVVQKGEKQVLKKYVIPEGFTVWIELAFRPKQRPLSMF